MPRIIAGSLGGRQIPSPPGAATRPTADRVREAVFSRLEGWDALQDARVLDLYAGTGALAFEALSRGARSAELLDASAKVCAQLRRTARALDLEERTSISTGRAQRRARQLAEAAATGGPRFDLVFLDPPYDQPTAEVEQVLTDLLPALDERALVVIERSARSAPPTWPPGCADDGSRSYGETVIHYGGPVNTPVHGA